MRALIFDVQGNPYGATAAGGAYHNGAVFKVSKSGKETILYSFTGGADRGKSPARFDFGREGKPLWHHRERRGFQQRGGVRVE